MNESQELGYNPRLSQVRGLPSKTSLEVDLKHEASRNFRIRNYLQWASLMDNLVTEIDNNSGHSSLRVKVEKVKKQLHHPKMAEELVGHIEKEMDLVQKTFSQFKKNAGMKLEKDISKWSYDSKSKMGFEIYKALTGKNPVGEVVVVDSALAISIQVKDSSDFNSLENRTNIGGFYVHRRKVILGSSSSGPSYVEFPLVVLKDSIDLKPVERHEQAHSINRTIINSLLEDPYKGGEMSSFNLRWGGLNGWNLPIQPIENSGDLELFFSKEAVPFSYTCAKDELLADYVANGNLNYVENLKKQNGVYDYMRDIVARLKKDNLLKNISDEELKRITNKFWGKYTETLDSQVKSMNTILEYYKKNKLWKRKDLFVYVLAQVPMLSWNKIVSQDFLTEAQYFHNNVEDAYKLGNILSEKREEITNSDSPSEKDHERIKDLSEKGDRINQARFVLKDWVEENPTESMFDETKKLDAVYRSIDF